ncbi:hypothetical protein LIER_28560 [Lithospermum erythrorhizon]|uniref:Uncharacterized protein n=1 Tax=Lithospermum erythrorhizon TaxID=34254 RepID=A0AAV3RGI8_LITER
MYNLIGLEQFLILSSQLKISGSQLLQKCQSRETVNEPGHVNSSCDVVDNTNLVRYRSRLENTIFDATLPLHTIEDIPLYNPHIIALTNTHINRNTTIVDPYWIHVPAHVYTSSSEYSIPSLLPSTQEESSSATSSIGTSASHTQTSHTQQLTPNQSSPPNEITNLHLVPLAMIPPSPDGVHQFPDSLDDSTGESSDSSTQNTQHSNDSALLSTHDLIQWLGEDSAD